ncbi:MAG: sugar transferase [Rhodobacterales bacterium]|nr:sugar transferase [Rhodobacterales bacterium]
MTPAKRALDLAVALLLAPLVVVLLLILIPVLLIREGRPVFYIAERMKTPTQAFGLIKLRTMRPATGQGAGGVTGGDKSARMSKLHRFLRRTRADELPQLWNVIRGDMSLVGPRPPLRVYVEDYPEIYGPVLQSRPGVTGLASLAFHAQEERMLAACATPAETDRVYRTRCIPRKARLDLIYQARRSLCFDLVLIGQTAARPFRHRGSSQAKADFI